MDPKFDPPPLDPAGLPAAVEALAPEGRLDAAAEQAELFETSPLLGDPARGEDLVPLKRRGRPPGALNKTTDDWKNYLLRNFRSPLIALAELATADPFALTRAIRAADKENRCDRDVSVMEVIVLQKAAAAELAPFVHRKQPIAIDAGEDKPLPMIQQLIVGADGVRALFPEKHAYSDASDVEPLAIEAEVAPKKSHVSQEEGPSD